MSGLGAGAGLEAGMEGGRGRGRGRAEVLGGAGTGTITSSGVA